MPPFEKRGAQGGARAALAAWILLMSLSLGHGAEALQEIVVKPGDTLWNIANFYLKDPKRWPEILQHNKQLSNDPTVALPGMKLNVPVLLIKEKLRAAELIYLLKDVRYRRNDSNAWKQARVNMELRNKDGLRTMKESVARVKFPTGEVVNLNENSLVLIRPEKGDEMIELLSGDVRASRSRVITAGGAQVNPLGPDVDYRTRVKLDKSELVLVYRGRVDVTAQGKTVRVPEGFGSEIKPMMPPAEPLPLPKIPLILQESEGADSRADALLIREQKTGQELLLSVEIPKSPALEQQTTRYGSQNQARAVKSRQVLEKYHFQVDANQGFGNPIVDQYHHVSQKLNLLKLGLPNGRYWWRIAFVDSLGMEGTFSRPQPFTIDLTPPAVVITYPGEEADIPWEENFLQLSGETEPETSVRVDGKIAPVGPQGQFSVRLFMHEGKNRIRVVAVDASGNETVLERVVYRLLPGQDKKFQRARRQEPEKAEKTSSNFLATFATGLLSIGTIVGIILLIVQ